MQWDLGPQGIAVLAGLSIAFGGIAIALLWHRAEAWIAGVVGAAAFFASGVFISEVWFGWATEAELQPNIDGLSFDEVLIAFLVGVPILVVIRLMLRHRTAPRLAH
ncbi:MAG TPA: hypothetical protein VIA82_00715 [Candidatus Limnocylindria bacterium]|jgi:hypothetical protein